MPNNVTIAATAAALNRQAVTYAAEIKAEFRVGLEFENELGLPWRSADTIYTATNVRVGEITQPYQPRFTPKGSTEFDAVDNTLRPIKIDLEWSEEELYQFFNSWKNDWFEGGRDPMTWTFPKYMLDMQIKPKYQEEMNEMAWNGVYSAPTSGVPGAFLDSVDGYNVTILNAISAGTLVPVASGSYDATNINSKIETWMLSMPKAVRGRTGTVLMADSWARKLYYDFRGDFATAIWSSLDKSSGGFTIDGTKVVVKGVKGMEGSNRWIYLPENNDNMILGTRNGYARDPQFIFDADLYSLKAKAVWYRFYGFEYWSKLFVNDQA